MDQINIEDIVLRTRRIFVKPGTKHPFVYPSGLVDLSGLGAKKLQDFNKYSNKTIIKKVLKYLKNPAKYVKTTIPIFPEYL